MDGWSYTPIQHFVAVRNNKEILITQNLKKHLIGFFDTFSNFSPEKLFISHLWHLLRCDPCSHEKACVHVTL